MIFFMKHTFLNRFIFDSFTFIFLSVCSVQGYTVEGIPFSVVCMLLIFKNSPTDRLRNQRPRNSTTKRQSTGQRNAGCFNHYDATSDPGRFCRCHCRGQCWHVERSLRNHHYRYNRHHRRDTRHGRRRQHKYTPQRYRICSRSNSGGSGGHCHTCLCFG